MQWKYEEIAISLPEQQWFYNNTQNDIMDWGLKVKEWDHQHTLHAARAVIVLYLKEALIQRLAFLAENMFDMQRYTHL